MPILWQVLHVLNSKLFSDGCWLPVWQNRHHPQPVLQILLLTQ